MTLKTLVITLVTGLALALSVPAAWGMSDASDRSQKAVVPDAFERAVAASLRSSLSVANYPDAVERAVASRQKNAAGPARSRDALDRAAPTSISAGTLAGHVDRYELDLPSGTVGTTTIDTSADNEWSHIGAGFGIGIALMLGLWLGLRAMRTRPLAH